MALLLAVLVLLPMAWLVVTSLRDAAKAFTLDHYRHLFVDPAFVKPLVTTLWTSAAVGTICVITAAPMAWLVARTDLPAKRLMRTLILASFVTPPFLGAFAWVLLGGPNAGLLNKWYYALFDLKPFVDASLINIFSAWGMVFVMALYTFPYVFTFVANSLDVIPSELEEASSILGAPAWRTAAHITLPLVLPALLAGFLVAFLQSMTLFGTPAILALPAGVDTMTTKIWSLFQFPPQLGLAAAASLPLLLITVVLLRTQTAIMGRRGYSVIGGKSIGRAADSSRPMEDSRAVAVRCRARLFDRVAVRSVAAHGLREELVGPGDRQLLARALALRVFRIQPDQVCVRKYFCARRERGNRSHDSGHSDRIPGLAQTRVGPSLSRVPCDGTGRDSRHRAGRRACFSATRSRRWCSMERLWIIFLAYLTKELPVGYQQIASSLKSVHPELEDASRIFGATRLRALFDITAPLIRNGVIATWILVFIGSIRELSATILLFTARTKTISVTMFDLRESNDWGPIAVLSITMLVITFVMVAAINFFTDRRQI